MWPPLIYYGKPGLEAQIFQTYMASSGYQVQAVYAREGALEAIGAAPNAIPVIALDKSPEELIELVGQLRARAGKNANAIFLLGGEQAFDPQMDAVYVVTRPFRLSDVITRIQAITRQKKDL